MPMKYVKPEEAFMICTDRESGEVRPVYHVYKDENIELRLTWWYTIDLDEYLGHEFDIRNLPNFTGTSNLGSTQARLKMHARLLQDALDNKFAWFDGLQFEWDAERYELYQQTNDKMDQMSESMNPVGAK